MSDVHFLTLSVIQIITEKMKFFLVSLVLSHSLLCQAWGKHLLIETEDQHRSEDTNMDDRLGKDYQGRGGDEFIMKQAQLEVPNSEIQVELD